MDSVRIIRRIKQNPKKAIDDANRGSAQVITELANFWQEVPELIDMGILNVFLRNLDSDKAPIDPSMDVPGSVLVVKAFMSLMGLTKLGDFLRGADKYGAQLIKGWPGVFKWSAFFYASRVQAKDADPQLKRSTIDVVTAAWYSVSRSDSACAVMATTKGSIEIATQLWILEDAGPIPPIIDIPSASAALDALLHEYHEGALDRVLGAAGGSADNVVQLALSRLRTAINSPEVQESRVVIYLDFIGHLSRDPNHALRHTFLNSNTIILCTKIACSVPKLMNAGGPPRHLDVMVSAFGYIRNCLESTDGFTWIRQAINAGLLTAFVDCSPQFFKLDPLDRDMIICIIKDIIPRYLVYRSVIEAVDGSMKKLHKPLYQERVLGSVAETAWRGFQKLALERLMVSIHAAAIKGQAATCDNVHCQKVDAKNTFRKCGSCSTTLYCSKECQVIAWKEGGHKTMCKMKQQERLEGKLQSVSKMDAAFFHQLATRDARRHLPLLRNMAAKDHPEMIQTAELVICIDYTVLPPKYSVHPLADYERHLPITNGSANAEARNDALIERAREHPGKFTIIQSTLSNGQSLQLVLTIVTGSFWKEDESSWPTGDGSDDEDPDEDTDDEYVKGTNIDEVDTMLARMTLNGLMKKFGDPARF